MSGLYVYVADYEAELRIISITSPSNPIELGHYDSPGYSEEIAVDNNLNLIYLANGPTGMMSFKYDSTVGTGRDETPKKVPRAFELDQNFPNHFNPTANIAFNIPGNSGSRYPVTLTIYDVRGNQVVRLLVSYLEAGSHRVLWNGRTDEGEQVSSGSYLYRLKSGDNICTRKMILFHKYCLS